VDLIDTTGERRDPVYADANGRFEFAAVTAARYTLAAWKSGYVQTTFGARTPWEPGAVVALAPGESASGFEIALARGGVVSGRIVDDAGEPVPDLQVTVGRAAPSNGRLQFQPVALPATTNDRGEYRVGGLPSGSFAVSIFGWVASASIDGGYDSSPRPRSVFYPQTPFLSQARPVIVRAGEEISSIDMAFTSDALVTPVVSGRIVDPRGPVAQAIVFASVNPDGVPSGGGGMTTVTRAAGEFSMRLPPGDYALSARGGRDLVATTRVVVDRADVTGIELVLAKGGRLSGRVMFEGTSQRPPNMVAVQAVAESPGAIGGGPFADANQPMRIRADGTFVLANLLGTFQLKVVPEMRGWHPKSITGGGRNLLDVPFDIKSGDDLRDVLVVMSDRTATLTGMVEGAAGSAFGSPLSVLIFPNDARQAASRARWVRPDQTGRFAASGLAPGEYLVALATDVDDLLWQTAPYLDRFRAGATYVTLRDGETRSITLARSDQR
jgi:hypothetical protein